MALAPAMTNELRGHFRAIQSLEHPTLAPEHVVVARLLALTWLGTGHVTWAPLVRLPWLEGLSVAHGWQPWATLQMLSGFLAAMVVLFTSRVRLGAAWLALTIAAGLLSSRAEFAYNRLFVASLLLALAAAAGRGRVLPRAQVAVLYLGAGLDKLLDADWRSGTFLSSFVEELARFGRLWSPGGFIGTANPVAQLAWSALPHWSFTAGSWLVIVTELALAWGFLRGARWILWPNVLLHVGIALLTGGTFGMFFYAGLAATVLVAGVPLRSDARLVWPGLAVMAAVLCLPWWSQWIAGLVLVPLVMRALTLSRPSATAAPVESAPD